MFFTGCSKAVILLWIIFVSYVLCLSCFLVCTLQPCGLLLGMGRPLGSVECDFCFLVFLLRFCHFAMRCPESGDCIDS